MDLSFLSQAEAVMLEMEKAKRGLEAAKASFEDAKRNYDEFLVRADEFGVPKAKLKKILEDRIAILFESGIMDFLENPNEAAAAKKPRKTKRVKNSSVESGSEATTAEEPVDPPDEIPV